MATWVLALIVFAIFSVLVLGLIYCVKVFNRPDGERFQKLDMQGPLAPLTAAEIKEDAERKRPRPVPEGREVKQ